MTVLMRRLAIVICSALLASSSLAATRPKRSALEDEFRLKLGELRQIQLLREDPATREEAADIKRRIRNLAKISNPDFGLSPTFSGSAFAPIAEAREAGTMLLTSHNVKTSPDLVELVKLGPKALPFLLTAIDDQTATKLIIPSHEAFGMMSFRNELSGNPANTNEQAIVDSAPEVDPFPSGQPPASYTVKVGDVCFVIIGQIVGRPYSAVRYQPSGIIVINSPPGEKSLGTRVRSIWSHEPERQFLLNSFLLDYATEAVTNGPGRATYFQCGAAMRLLHYFPNETSEFIAERIRKLDVRGGRNGSAYSDSQLKDYMHREQENKVGTVNFLKAVAWCRQPLVVKEVQGVFERTTDAEIALAWIPTAK
jgi:hypothetical protein